MAPRQKNDKKLICIDIDHTMIDLHHHNILMDARAELMGRSTQSLEQRYANLQRQGLNADFNTWRAGIEALKQHPDSPEQQFRFLQQCGIGVIGNAKEWRDAITSLVQDGHQVALTSFTAFKLGPIFLTELIGLPKEIADKIHIETWLPENAAQADKNQHIANTIQKTMGSIDPANVLLIDDSERNIHGAAKAGYRTVLATPHANQVDRLVETAIALRKQHETFTRIPPKPNTQPASRSYMHKIPENPAYKAFHQPSAQTPDPALSTLKNIQQIVAEHAYWKTKVRLFGIPDGVKAIHKLLSGLNIDKLTPEHAQKTLNQVKNIARKHQDHGGGSDPLFHRHKDTDNFYTAIRRGDNNTLESLVNKLAENEHIHNKKPR